MILRQALAQTRAVRSEAFANAAMAQQVARLQCPYCHAHAGVPSGSVYHCVACLRTFKAS